MNLQTFREKIAIICEEYYRDWIKNHKESNLIDYIEYNSMLKKEIYKELNKYDNKTVLKEINKKIQKERDLLD